MLHLTDLHFSERSAAFPSSHYWNSVREENGRQIPEWPSLAEPEYNRRGLLESLLKDLTANGWTPDLVIISGDLLDRAQESGVKLALDFLERLAQGLSLGRERFVLVPGNHDEARNATTPDERYAAFSRIWTGFYGESRPWVSGRAAHQQVELFDLREPLGVQLIGFNSCEGHDRGLLTGGAVGAHQLERAEQLLQKHGEAPFRIAVMHHHLYNPTGARRDLSVMEGAAEIRRWLKKHHFQLAVHGHQHVDWHEEDSAGDWILSVVAGASAGVGRYGREAWDLRIGYQVLRIEGEGSGYRIRRWYDPGSRSFEAASPNPREALRFGAWQAQSQPPVRPPDRKRLGALALAVALGVAAVTAWQLQGELAPQPQAAPPPRVSEVPAQVPQPEPPPPPQAKPSAAPLTVRLTARVLREGTKEPTLFKAGQVLRSGDRVAFEVEVSQPAHVYLVQRTGATKALTILFPDPRIQVQNPLSAGQPVRIPSGDRWFRLTDQDIGTERVFVIASPIPLDRLEGAVRKAGTQAAEAESVLMGLMPLPPGCEAGAASLDESACGMKGRALVYEEPSPSPSRSQRSSVTFRVSKGDDTVVGIFQFRHVKR